MAKIKFTQLLKESEEKLSASQAYDKLCIAFESDTDKLQELEDDKIMMSEDEFLDKYKDDIEKAKDIEVQEKSEPIDNSDIALDTDENVKVEDVGIDEKTKKAQENADEAFKKTFCATFGITNLEKWKKDVEYWEKFYPYTSLRKRKDEIEVMYVDPVEVNGKTVKPFVKSNSPEFETVASKNEFALYSIAKDYYEKSGVAEILSKPIAAVAGRGEYGSQGNINLRKLETQENIKKSVSESLKVLNNFKYRPNIPGTNTKTEKDVDGNILLFIYSKIFGAVINFAHGAGKFSNARYNILSSGMYQDAFLEMTESSKEDLLTDVIRYGYIALLSGVYGLKSLFPNAIQSIHYAKSGNCALTVFDFDRTIGSSEKNPFLSMEDAFTNCDKWEWKQVHKKSGTGRIKTIGANKLAQNIAQGDYSVDTALLDYETGSLSKDELDCIQRDLPETKRRASVATTNIEPIPIIANKVTTNIMGFFDTILRKYFSKYGLTKIYGRAYWNENQLEEARLDAVNNPNDPKKKEIYQRMLKDVEAWQEARKNLMVARSNISLDAETSDGRRYGDSVADDKTGEVNTNRDEAGAKVKDAIKSIKGCISNMATMATYDDVDTDSQKSLELRMRVTYAVAALCKFIYVALKYPSITIDTTLAATFGIGDKMANGSYRKVVSPDNTSNFGVSDRDISKYEDFFKKNNIDLNKLCPSFGFSNANLRDSFITLKSREANDWFLNDPEGPKTIDALNKFLSDTNVLLFSIAQLIIEKDPTILNRDREVILKKLNWWSKPMAEDISELAKMGTKNGIVTMSDEYVLNKGKGFSFLPWINSLIIPNSKQSNVDIIKFVLGEDSILNAITDASNGNITKDNIEGSNLINDFDRGIPSVVDAASRSTLLKPIKGTQNVGELPDKNGVQHFAVSRNKIYDEMPDDDRIERLSNEKKIATRFSQSLDHRNSLLDVLNETFEEVYGSGMPADVDDSLIPLLKFAADLKEKYN